MEPSITTTTQSPQQAAPYLQSTAKYYNGLTIFNFRKAILRWDTDGRVRAFDVTDSAPQTLFEVMPNQIQSAHLELTQLVLMVDGKKYRFDLLTGAPMAAFAPFGMLGMAIYYDKAEQSDATKWISGLQSVGVAVGNTDPARAIKLGLKAGLAVVVGVVVMIIVTIFIAIING